MQRVYHAVGITTSAIAATSERSPLPGTKYILKIIPMRLLLLGACLGFALPEEVAWDDKNILLDGTPSKWVQSVIDPLAPAPPPPFDQRWTSNSSNIVVEIAALRESRLVKTIYDFLSKAAHPERVHFAVVQQNSARDVDCVAGLCEKFGTPIKKDANGEYIDPDKKCKYFDNVRVIRMKDTEAQGPVFARARQAELIKKDDDFCMQIDAHTDVIQNWDNAMLKQWGAIGNEYGVITSYPTNIHDLGKNVNGHWEMPVLCEAHFVGNGLVSNAQASAAANLETPLLSPLWAAGLSFSRCHAEINVPNDINLKGIFSGEEYGRGARLWTHGYDFYAITRPILGTYYGGEKGNSGSWHTPPGDQKKAENRLATLLKWPGAKKQDLGFHSLGERRTLEQYAAFSGVDTIHKKTTKHCYVKYVPWDVASLGAKNNIYSEYEDVSDISDSDIAKKRSEAKGNFMWKKAKKLRKRHKKKHKVGRHHGGY